MLKECFMAFVNKILLNKRTFLYISLKDKYNYSTFMLDKGNFLDPLTYVFMIKYIYFKLGFTTIFIEL